MHNVIFTQLFRRSSAHNKSRDYKRPFVSCVESQSKYPATSVLTLSLFSDAALIPLIEDLFKELAMIEACNKVILLLP